MTTLRTVRIVVLALSVPLAGLAQSPLSQLGGLKDRLGDTALSDSKIGEGLKQALSVGTKNAVHLVDKPGGYLDNPAIKIPLPKALQPVEGILRGAGQGPKIDGFISSMNHAAESAAPAAEQIFADAVTAMTIDDARKLLHGGDTSIT